MALTKKTPVRRCVGCGEHFPKNTLIRAVKRNAGGTDIEEYNKLLKFLLGDGAENYIGKI